MISWIVASHRPDIYTVHLQPSLRLDGDDEIVLLENYPSITEAYAVGQKLATQPVRAYIHHDVRVTNYPVLHQELVQHTMSAGIVGVIGARGATLPWWVGSVLGSVIDVRLGTINFGAGGQCAVLDGVLLATRHDLDWATDAPGWHGYDHDACLQMLAKGHLNWCLSNGHSLLAHYATSPTNIDLAVGWHDAVAWYQQRWAEFDRLITEIPMQADVPL